MRFQVCRSVLIRVTLSQPVTSQVCPSMDVSWPPKSRRAARQVRPRSVLSSVTVPRPDAA